MREVWIDGRRIADDAPCYVIADIGNTHQGSVATACDLIRLVARAGGQAAKFQLRHLPDLYSDEFWNKPYDHELSFGRTYGEHRQHLELPLDVYVTELIPEAKRANVALFATAFDEISADRCVALEFGAIKLGSFAITDRPLLQHVASLGLPVLLSTGGADDSMIDQAVSWYVQAGRSPLALLHCTASYPTDVHELNLRCIGVLRQRYPEFVIGWSGHDNGIAMALIAWAFGARIIEKHVTLNRAMKGTDHAFALESEGFRKLVRDVHRAEAAVGDGIKCFYESERGPMSKMRRIQTEHGWQITGQLNPSTRTS